MPAEDKTQPLSTPAARRLREAMLALAIFGIPGTIPLPRLVIPRTMWTALVFQFGPPTRKILWIGASSPADAGASE